MMAGISFAPGQSLGARTTRLGLVGGCAFNSVGIGRTSAVFNLSQGETILITHTGAVGLTALSIWARVRAQQATPEPCPAVFVSRSSLITHFLPLVRLLHSHHSLCSIHRSGPLVIDFPPAPRTSTLNYNERGPPPRQTHHVASNSNQIASLKTVKGGSSSKLL